MFRTILDHLLDIAFPLACLGCGKDDILLCSFCRARIANQSTLLHAPSPHLDYAIVCAPYENAIIQSLVKHFKFKGVTDLAEPLAALMAGALARHNLPPATLIPVPLHRKKEIRRGYNQSSLLANALARSLALPLDANLTRIRNNPPQARLPRAKRLRNTEGVFRYAGGQAPDNVLLVDDIATTMSTLESAAKELMSRGTARVSAVVIAKNTD